MLYISIHKGETERKTCKAGRHNKFIKMNRDCVLNKKDLSIARIYKWNENMSRYELTNFIFQA